MANITLLWRVKKLIAPYFIIRHSGCQSWGASIATSILALLTLWFVHPIAIAIIISAINYVTIIMYYPPSANHIIMYLSNWLCLLLFTHICHSIHKTTLWDHLFCRLKKEDLNQVLFWFQNHWNFILIHTLKTFSGSYIVPEFWHNKFHNTVI